MVNGNSDSGSFRGEPRPRALGADVPLALQRQAKIAIARSLDETEASVGGIQGPNIAREVLRKFKSIPSHQLDADAILLDLAESKELTAVRIAAFLQRLELSSGLEKDPSFSLALARAYFRRLDALVDITLSPQNVADRKLWRDSPQVHEDYESIPQLEAAFLTESAKAMPDMHLLVGIADTLRQNRERASH